MSDRERYQAMMLDYIYGLLEPEEIKELEAYLASGPDGEMLRQHAEEWKQQLASAARAEFPAVQFGQPIEAALDTAPVVPASAPVPATIPMASQRTVRSKVTRPAPRMSFRLSWTIAASLLVVALGFGFPAMRSAVKEQELRTEVAQAQKEFQTIQTELKNYTNEIRLRNERVQSDLSSTKTTHEQLLKEFDKELAAARKAIEDKQFIVRLTGPERIQPGAPNEWRIETVRRDRARVQPRKIEMLVKNQKGEVLHKEEKVAETRDGFREPPTLALPAEFWFKPEVKADTEFYLDVAAYDDLNTPSRLCEKVQLARPVFTTHLVTDKPMYKPGETIYFRSLTLDRATFLPPEHNLHLKYTLVKPDKTVHAIDAGVAKLTSDPQQSERNILGPDKKPLRGIGCGEFQFPVDPVNFPGGEYILTVSEVSKTVDEVQNTLQERENVLATRKIILNEYKPEIFEKKLEFDGKSYGPGDIVLVRADASRVQGKLANARVTATATIDGMNVPVENPGKTDAEGVVRLRFKVPTNLTKGEGSLTVTFTDATDSEPITRNIPLIGREINIEFFPEGGDLVVGVPSRVYFQARTPQGKPADLEGYLTDGSESLAEIRTVRDAEIPGMNRGQGMFTFTPQAGRNYYLKLRKPSNIIEPLVHLETTPRQVAGAVGMSNLMGGMVLAGTSVATGYELPRAKTDGLVLTALDPVSKPGEPIRVKLQVGQGKKNLLIGAYTRGRLMDHQRAVAEAGKAVEVLLQPRATIGGVTRLTVFEERSEGERSYLAPVAERLIYRKPAEQLLLNVQADKTRYLPGGNVGLEIFAMNEKEKPVPAVLMVAVVNQSVLTMADEKTARQMPTHFLLATEVNKPEDLEHADFLLSDDPKLAPKAAQALDLLLGTQGWRRFAEQKPQHPNPRFKEEVERLLVLNGQRTQIPQETLRQEEARVRATYQPKLEIALTRSVEAEEAKAQLDAETPAIQRKFLDIEGRYHEAERALASVSADLAKVQARQRRFIPLAVLPICVALLLFSGICAYRGMTRKGREAVPYYAGAGVVLTASLAIVLFGLFIVRPDAPNREFASREIYTLPAELAPPEVRFEIGLADNLKMEAMEGANADRQALAPAADAGGFAPPAKPAGPGGPFPPMMPGAALGGGRGQGGFRGGEGGAAMKGKGGFRPPPLERQGADPKFAANKEAKHLQGQLAQDKAYGRKGRDEIFLEREQRKAAEAKDAEQFYRKGLKDLDFAKQRAAMTSRYQAMNQLQKREIDALRMRQIASGLPNRGPVGFPGAGGPGILPGMPADPRGEEFAQAELTEHLAPFFVREYAHKGDPARTTRSDFTETVYWHPVLVLPESGRTEVRFELSDDITRYQVLVAGHTMDGRIGAVTTQLQARMPFSVDPKTPIEVTSTDRIDIPVRVMNDSDDRRFITFSVTPDGLKPIDVSRFKDGVLDDSIELAPLKGGRKIFAFQPSRNTGDLTLRVVATSDPMAIQDDITRKFRVVPEGFPVNGAYSDLLEGKANGVIVLPADFVKDTLKVSLKVYPTTLSDLQAGLEGLLREPSGCFEQTSTSNYPNLLILDYLKNSDQAKPEVAQRARALIERGYGRLISFECPHTPTSDKQGFEWFGGKDQQHEALTAYGLLQFKDLARVYDKVDMELIRRTQKFLLSRRDGKGGFLRNSRAIDSFGRAPENITNAYIVWALIESDPEDKESLDLSKELNALATTAREMLRSGKEDTYFLALVANSLLQRPAGSNRDLAIDILKRIAEKHQKEGRIDGAKTSITASGGRDLQIETTSLTVLGWLRSNEKVLFGKAIKDATKWISQQRGGYGGFGSTQSTILALKALIEHTKKSKTPAESGTITLTINGKIFSRPFSEKDIEVIELDIPNPAEVLKPGENEVKVEITGKTAYPFSVSWNCNTLTPLSAEKCALELSTKLAREKALEGQTVPLQVTLKNKLDQNHGMATAIIGIPGGMKIPTDMNQLKELTEKGTISFFEIRGRELILYWRALQKQQQIDLTLDLIAELPGEYRGPASRGYLYYNADHKHWIKPLSISIAPTSE